VCVAALGLNVISDIRDGGQNEIPVLPSFTKKRAKYSLSCSSLQAQGRLSTRSSKLDGCRAEVDDATPKLNIAFSERHGTFAPWLFRAKSARPVPNVARMRAWSMTRSRCRCGWEHTTREKLDGGRAWSFARQGLSKPRQKILCLGIPGLLQPEKGSADEEILGLGGTESCLLRPISRPGRHLIRMVCDPPSRTNQPCRSMRKCLDHEN
jgi:hypothetical protein